jgi:cobalt-precorrin 5A hydrolase
VSDRPGIWCVRPEGEALARQLAAGLDATLFLPWRRPDAPARAQFAAAWPTHRHWVLIMATGIAVRYLDGLAENKHTDPAAVVLDEAARFAVALLCGHEGGGNALAYRVARLTGATPVITTASEALKPLTLGIGCRKGIGEAGIEAAVRAALATRRLDEVREVATIDLKADEPGLLAFCRRHELPLRVIARADVAARGWTGTPSDWVRQNLGVDGVCEPCALIASPRGRLIVPKTPHDGVTVAVVEDKPEQEPPHP